MKKYTLFYCLIIIFLSTDLSAQIGINTNNPVGLFDVDVLGNNNLVTNNYSDDVVMRVNSNSEASLIVGGGSVQTNYPSSLELLSTQKALLLNRVALTSYEDYTTILNPVEGMLVYNTNTSTGLASGLYQFIYDSWSILDIPQHLETNKVNIKELANTAGSSATNSQQIAGSITRANIDVGTGSKIFNYRELGSDNADKGSSEILITDSGRYLFIFRWYGLALNSKVAQSAFASDVDYYVYIFKAGTELPLVKTLVKPWGGRNNTTGNNFSNTSMITTPFLEEGDIVSIAIGAISEDTANPWRLVSNVSTYANRSSMVYFKIQ